MKSSLQAHSFNETCRRSLPKCVFSRGIRDIGTVFFSFFVIHLQIKGVSRTLWCEDGVKLVPLEWKMICLGDCPPAHQHCCGNAGVSGRQSS